MRPRWKLIGIFYGISLGWVALVALGLWFFGYKTIDASASKVAQLALAFLYMPAPLVASLIVERIAGDETLIRHAFDGFGRKWLRILLTPILAMGGWFALAMGAVWVLGNALHVPGVGTLASTKADVIANISAVLGPNAMTPQAIAQMPDPKVLLLIGGAVGLIAGFTVNGLFAYGEEYGWRGWLMNELRSLGPVKANVITGTMWGLWHAPVIFMGFNYGPYRLVGPLFMVIMCIPLSFLLWRGRDFTGSTLVPAIMHGAMNGCAGFFIFAVGGANELVRAPVGLLGAACFAIVAAIVWAVTRGRLRDTVNAERATPELARRANPEAATTPA